MLTVISRCALDGHCNFGMVAVVSCCFLLHFGWSLLFPGALCMVIVISWCALDGRSCFPVRSGWSLSFLGVFWLVAVVSSCTLDGHCFFSGTLWMVTIISWSVHKQHMSHTGKHKAKQ